ncbi:MAG: TIGR02646 family protein [Verrucomicrobia bacterium]|nr:TIGR02646 family protein [Verrucomicrobiota bacterium]
MRHIIHAATPPRSIVAAYRAQPHPLNPGNAWDDFDSTELREHLWELQHGLCAYCERALNVGPGTSSIEHIVPKTANPQVTFQYTNLVWCCLDQNTCNLHKKGQHFAGCDAAGRWSQGFIAPTQERCETSFTYERDGSVNPSQAADEPDATQTLRILNLNHQPLKTERLDYLLAVDIAIDSMADQLDAIVLYLTAELALGSLKPFFSAKHQHFSLTA